MVFGSDDPPALYFDSANTARQTRARYRFQDECVALRCVQNLAVPALRAVVVEWCSDYLTVSTDGTVELVSIKHREPDQRSWTASELGKPVADLFRYWQATGERCRCVFGSNMGVPRETVRRLPAAVVDRAAIPLADARRFVDEVMTFNAAVLPQRDHITAVAVDTMRGVLVELDRDPAFADACYRALVARVSEASAEEPASAREKATRLAGSMRAVLARGGPDLHAQTLTLVDLRALVLTVHDDCAGEPVRPATPLQRSGAQPRRPAALLGEVSWAGGERVRLGSGTFLVHDPVTVADAPDRSHGCMSAAARQLEPAGRDVWLRRVHIRRDTEAAVARREALRREATLMREIASTPGAPRLVEVHEDETSTTLVIAPAGRALPQVYGPLGSAYPALAVDALLRGVSTLGQVLSALHERGYAHRELSSHVLVVTGPRGDLALRDLGLATVAPAPGEGPPGYRAPEQDRPLVLPPGPPTDVYQLAALVYQALTGRLPGPEPVPPSLLRPTLSAAVDDVVLPALRQEQDRRTPLRRWCAELGRLAAVAVVIGP